MEIYGTGAVIASTANFSYQNKEKIESTSAKIEGSIFNHSVTIEGKHIDDRRHDNYFTFFDKNQLNCNNTEITIGFSREKNRISIENGKNISHFIGIDLEGYLGIGGYIKIGFQF